MFDIPKSADCDFILDRLAIGALSSRSIPGFRAIISCLAPHQMRELPNTHCFPAHNCLHIPIADGIPGLTPYIDKAITFIRGHIAQGPVLIHCGAGNSRSVSVTIAYLVSCGFSCQEAKAFIAARRPSICPAPIFLDEIKQHFGIER